MKKLLFLLMIAIPVLTIGQQSNKPGLTVEHPTQLPSTVKAKKVAKHTHEAVSQKVNPQSGKAEATIFKDATSIKKNVVDYALIDYQCRICGQWYQRRKNLDTFSTVKKAKYSNLKYLKSVATTNEEAPLFKFHQ